MGKNSRGIGKKGKLFFDEGANKKLIKPTQEMGFRIKQLPPSSRGIGISDSTIVKMAKGMPIVTDDYTSYKESGAKSNKTGYIQHDTVSSKDFPEYIFQRLSMENFI